MKTADTSLRFSRLAASCWHSSSGQMLQTLMTWAHGGELYTEAHLHATLETANPQTGAVSFLSGRLRPLGSISNEKVSAGLQYRRLMSNIGGPWQKYEPPLLGTGRLISERADWASCRGRKKERNWAVLHFLNPAEMSAKAAICLFTEC